MIDELGAARQRWEREQAQAAADKLASTARLAQVVREARKTMTGSQIAEVLGVTRQRVFQLADTHAP